MLIVFLVSTIGFLIVMRTFYQVAGLFGFSKQATMTIFVSLLGLIIFAVLLLHSRPFLLWIFIGIILISLNFSPLFLKFILIRSMKKRLIPLLDQVILGLQVGQSFRSALLSAIEEQNAWFRRQLLEIYNAMITTQGASSCLSSPFIEELKLDWTEIDRSQNKIVDQVKALRRQIKIMEDFRRKSGQVTQQIKMQAIIVTALYTALLIFVSSNFGFFTNLKLILFSAAIFLGGLTWIFMIGRKMTWKV